MGPVVPVILAGGTGSRLWPLSRELFPKQFQSLFHGESLLQSTLRRAAVVADSSPIIVCNEEHRFLVAEQCRVAGTPWRRIILEAEIDAAIAATGARSMKDMGALMGVLRPRVQGRADMGALSARVKARLAG